MTRSIEYFINKIINDKWENIIPQIPDNSVDIVITSPVYNVSLGQNKFRDKSKGYDVCDDNMTHEDYLNWMDGLYTECYRVLKPGGRICINIGDGANGCYDNKTEILTKSGWKLFSDLTCEDDVVTLNPISFNVEWQKPTAVQKYEYNGEMKNIKHARMDLMVTPNHRMLVEKHHTSGWHFDEIQNFHLGQYYIPGAIGKCSDVVIDDFVLQSLYLRNRKNKEIPLKKIKMGDFAEFLGWYISEGCCSCNPKNKFCITISQSVKYNPHKHEQIMECVKRMGYNPIPNKNGVRIYDKQLCCWLNKNIKKYAENKSIPDFVMELPYQYLKIFFYTMIEGDGCRHCNGQIRFYTSSKSLSGQMQAVGLKIGMISTLNIRKRDGGKIGGRQITGKFPSHEVTFSKRERLWFDAKYITKKHYSGYVYCCSVPNTVIYVNYPRINSWASDFTENDFSIRAEPALKEVITSIGVL